MYGRSIILIVSFLLFACQNESVKNNSLEKPLDSIAKYYEISKDKSKTPTKRLEAINTSYKLLSDTFDDSLVCKILYQKAARHNSLEEYDSLLYYNTLLLEKATSTNNYYYQGRANYLKAYHFYKVQSYPDSAFYYYNVSKNNFLILGDSSQVGRKLINMAHIQQNKSDYFGGKETATEALKFLSNEKDIKYIASAYDVLATCHRKLLNYKDAIRYYTKAIKTTNSVKDSLLYSNDLAAVYIDNHQYDQAIQLLDKIVKDSITKTLPDEKARALDNLAYARWFKNSSDESVVFNEALEIKKKHNDKRGLIASHTHLGEFYLKNDSEKSSLHLVKAIEIARAIKKPKGELDALLFLMEIKPNDLTIKDRYISLNDSLRRKELLVKTQFAKIQYDDTQKSEEIENLRYAKILQQQAIKTERTIYLLSGVILLLILGFLGYYFVQKHKKEKELKVYQTEKRIAKKIHDELASDISTLTTYVDESNPASVSSMKKYLWDKLGDLYIRARNISIEMSGIDTHNFKQNLVHLIQQYNTSSTRVVMNLNEFEWNAIAEHKKIAVYRVLQELLINTYKHSKSSIVTLIVKEDEKERRITYTDNGIGFNKEITKMNGLTNAGNRIENIGGAFNFETKLGQGFKAVLIF